MACLGSPLASRSRRLGYGPCSPVWTAEVQQLKCPVNHPPFNEAINDRPDGCALSHHLFAFSAASGSISSSASVALRSIAPGMVQFPYFVHGIFPCAAL